MLKLFCFWPIAVILLTVSLIPRKHKLLIRSIRPCRLFSYFLGYWQVYKTFAREGLIIGWGWLCFVSVSFCYSISNLVVKWTNSMEVYYILGWWWWLCGWPFSSCYEFINRGSTLGGYLVCGFFFFFTSQCIIKFQTF